jgi:hypothetical protein
MFNVIVAFKNSERNWQFLFKDNDRATLIITRYHEAASKLHDDKTLAATISITDDFGVSALIPFDDIAGIVVDDMTKSVDAGVERGIQQMRGQAKTETKIKNDPALKLFGPVGPMNGAPMQQRRPF